MPRVKKAPIKKDITHEEEIAALKRVVEDWHTRATVAETMIKEYHERFPPHTREAANTRQVGGRHYKGMPIQPWDFIEQNGIAYLEGTAIKYLARWKKKGGIDDLEKAIHFIQKRIELERDAKDTQDKDAEKMMFQYRVANR